jgi:tripartite-type tricarboxylate transporter receptor subunit TctC
MRSQLLLRRAICVAAFFSSTLCAASGFPERPVRIVVPFAAGGAADTLGRELAARLSEVWSRPVVVENRPGATGAIGAQAVQSAAADGHTLLLTASAPVVLVPALAGRRSEFLSDFTPISTVAAWDLILVSNPSVPVKDVKQLMGYAKTAGSSLSYASAGNGAVNHVAGAVLARMAGVDMVHVPYNGDGPGMADLLSGRVTLSFLSSQVALPQVRSGKLNALAVAGPARLPTLGDVPTMVESGFKEFEFRAWVGLFGPKGLPAPVQQEIQGAVAGAMNQDTVRARLQQTGSAVDTSSSAAFAERIQRETEKWRYFSQMTGIKGE